MTKTVDGTPRWADILHILIANIENGRFETRQAAMDQLERMAELADAYVAIIKAQKEQTNG